MLPFRLSLLLLLSLPSLAGAQDAPPPTPGAVRLGEHGFTLESANGDFRLRLGALLQIDGRFFMSDDAGLAADTLVLRRVRPSIEGTVFGEYDFRIVPDFAGGQAQIQDAYVEVHPDKALRLRAGRFKVPFGLEFLQNDAYLPFTERALPTNLVPGRDVGLGLHGALRGGLLSYALGAFNGTVDGGNSEGDDEDGKDVVGRLFLHPLRPLGMPALAQLGVGFAASYGRTSGSSGLPVYRTSGLQAFFRYRAASVTEAGAVANGERVRYSPQAYWYVGPLGLQGEYVRSSQEVAVGGSAPERLTHEAWAATAALVVYGGSAAYDGVKARTPFRPARGEWGALEVAMRYAQLRVDADTFPTYADPALSARVALYNGAAINLYLNPFTRISLDLARTEFDGGAAGDGDRETELMLLGRVQLNF